MEVVDLDETFEYALPIAFGNTDPGVLHTDFHSIFLYFVKDSDASLVRKFDRVIDKVGNHLRDPLGICPESDGRLAPVENQFYFRLYFQRASQVNLHT